MLLRCSKRIRKVHKHQSCCLLCVHLNALHAVCAELNKHCYFVFVGFCFRSFCIFESFSVVVLLFYGRCVLLCGSFETFVTFSHNFEIVLNYIVFILIFFGVFVFRCCLNGICNIVANSVQSVVFWWSFVFHLFVSISSSLYFTALL